MPEKQQEMLGAVVAGELDESAPEVRALYAANPHLVEEVAALKALAAKISRLAKTHQSTRRRTHQRLFIGLVVAMLAVVITFIILLLRR